ncbi:hypothetical protein PRECH8_27380 [Insulibacter thermoxylanivorax]|uniref:O-antigen ligase-related domain-containing protein n=1 Tax=Insulibacter thermoxylanivorax TaxID=2749268 RepID=A0A916VGI2_9BACL|nr:O-antigen ligase family protein [Insulibacter thermoxylanivorax]GFR39442.1 hypothetical protein PRECH8_27380 [Insulibacter thermoxylanivorax]
MLDKAKAILFHRMTWLYVLLAFPIIDYILRNIIPIPIVSSLWDEGLLVLLLCIVVLRMLDKRRRLPSVRTPLIAFTVLGVAMFVFDMARFGVNIEGFRAVYQYILAFIIGFYILDKESEAMQLFRLFVIIGGLIGLHGVYQYIIGVEVPASWIDASETVRTRSYSIVQSPNVLGSYMALTAPIAAGLALTDRGRRRWLWAVLAVIMLAALVFTGSRGAWLAFGGAIGLALLFLNRKLFIGFLIAAVLSSIFVPQISSRFAALFNPEYLAKSSENGRIQRWIGAYDQMRSNPIFGTGLGHYGGAVADRHFGTIYVDSYYFKTLAEMGLLGLGVYLWLMYMLLRNTFDIWKGSARTRQFYLYGGIFAGLLAVILHNGVENIFEVPFMNTFFWLIAGVLLSLPYLKPFTPGGQDPASAGPDSESDPAGGRRKAGRSVTAEHVGAEAGASAGTVPSASTRTDRSADTATYAPVGTSTDTATCAPADTSTDTLASTMTVTPVSDAASGSASDSASDASAAGSEAVNPGYDAKGGTAYA